MVGDHMRILAVVCFLDVVHFCTSLLHPNALDTAVVPLDSRPAVHEVIIASGQDNLQEHRQLQSDRCLVFDK
jgi:hypothetical protein